MWISASGACCWAPAKSRIMLVRGLYWALIFNPKKHNIHRTFSGCLSPHHKIKPWCKHLSVRGHSNKSCLVWVPRAWWWFNCVKVKTEKPGVLRSVLHEDKKNCKAHIGLQSCVCTFHRAYNIWVTLMNQSLTWRFKGSLQKVSYPQAPVRQNTSQHSGRLFILDLNESKVFFFLFLYFSIHLMFFHFLYLTLSAGLGAWTPGL